MTWKIVCIDIFLCLKQDTQRYKMSVHVYFMLYLVKRKRWLVHMLLDLRCYSDLSWLKEPQNGIYSLNLFKNYKMWKLRLCFHTKSNLLYLVCWHIVSFLLASMYFSLRENVMCSVRAPWLVGRSNSNYRDEGQLGLHSFPAEPIYIFKPV